MSKIPYLIAKEDWNALAELKAVDPLIKVLDDLIENDQLWEADSGEIFGALGKIGDTKAVNFLIKCLQNEEDTVRTSAAQGLGSCNFSAITAVEREDTIKRAIEALIHTISDEEDTVREYVSDTLSGFGEKAVGPLISLIDKGVITDIPKNELTSYYPSDVLCSMVEALAYTESKNAVDTLIKVLHKSSFTVYNRKDKVLAEIKGWDLLKSQTTAARGLGLIGDKRAIEPLNKALELDDMDVRLEAACSLGLMDDSNGIKILVTEYKAAKKTNRSRCKNLLEKIPPKKVGAVLENLELYDDAEEWYTSAGILDKAAEMRKKKADMGAAKVSQKIVQGDEITKTEIKDSVLNRSTVGGGSSKMQELKELKEMFDSDFISKEEMEKIKKEILEK